jgi:cell division protein FtsQ
VKGGASIGRRHAARPLMTGGALPIAVLFVIAIATSAWVTTGVVAQERWPIRWLELHGDFNRVSPEQLRAALVPLVDTSYFTLDQSQLHQAAARNPWVSSIAVRKQWPDTVVVAVQEHRPVAHWNAGSLISHTGIAFEVPEADEIQGLPWLYGPEGRLSAVLEYWSGFTRQLEPTGLEVQSIHLNERGSLKLRLSNGTRVELGHVDIALRLRRLIAGWNALLTEGRGVPEGIDLRYSNGFAVSWVWPEEKGTES